MTITAGGFWFFVFMTNLFYSTLANAQKSEKADMLIVLAAAICASGSMVLMYYAGIFYWLTGYAGNYVAFSIWLMINFILVGCALHAANLFGILRWIFGMFLIYQIDGFSQLWIMVNS